MIRTNIRVIVCAILGRACAILGRAYVPDVRVITCAILGGALGAVIDDCFVDGVARRASYVGDDRAVGAGEPVEQARLTHVGPP
eukprot:1286731-Prymnesium_polylepis.2